MAIKNIPEDTNSVNYRTVHLKFSDEEITAIDLWQEQHKIRTRSEAIRQMIQQTLRATMAVMPPLQGETALEKAVREEVARQILRMKL